MQNREKPWEHNNELTELEASKIIGVNFPELRINEIKRLGSGWDNTTWLINDEKVFRLPKHKEAATLIQNEINILPNLPALGVETPKPDYICLKPTDYPFPIYGHQFLHGTSCDAASLTDNDRVQLADSIALFLKKLHNFPLDKARKLNIEYDRIGRLDVRSRIGKLEYQVNYLSTHNLISKEKLLIKYFKEHIDLHIPNEVVLGHGDFYSRHILLDKNKHLSAVIDWGDSELLHPAIDLAIVYQFFPIKAHQRFWEVYGPVDMKTKELAKLRAIYAASGMGWYAHSVQDKTLLQESIASLERLLEIIV